MNQLVNGRPYYGKVHKILTLLVHANTVSIARCRCSPHLITLYYVIDYSKSSAASKAKVHWGDYLLGLKCSDIQTYETRTEIVGDHHAFRRVLDIPPQLTLDLPQDCASDEIPAWPSRFSASLFIPERWGCSALAPKVYISTRPCSLRGIAQRKRASRHGKKTWPPPFLLFYVLLHYPYLLYLLFIKTRTFTIQKRLRGERFF